MVYTLRLHQTGSNANRRHSGRYRTVVGFTTNYAISAESGVKHQKPNQTSLSDR
jgi:hypothetical protein